MKNFKSKDKSLIEQRSTEIVKNDFSEFPDSGQGDISIEDLPRPSLRLLQSGSNQCKKQHDKYIEGAMPGMIVNTSTLEKYSGAPEDEEVLVMIVRYMNREVEWRRERGGYIADYPFGHPYTKNIKLEPGPKKGSAPLRITENDHVLVNTAIYHCLAFFKGNMTPNEAIIDMSSTQWECAKNINAYINSQTYVDVNGISQELPIWANILQLYSKFHSKGDETWFKWKFSPTGRLDMQDPIHYQLAKRATKYRKQVEAGEINHDFQQGV